MRLLVDLVVLATLLAIIAGAVLHHRAVSRERAAVQEVRSDIRRIEQELKMRAATGSVEVNGRGWPVEIDANWFGDNPPKNRLISTNRPWLEIAPPAHAELIHPSIRIAFDESVAAFWYNPANGIVRARVPQTVSDRRATELYNRINRVSLASIFENLTFPDRKKPGDAAQATDSAVAEAGEADVLEEEMNLDPTIPLAPAPR